MKTRRIIWPALLIALVIVCLATDTAAVRDRLLGIGRGIRVELGTVSRSDGSAVLALDAACRVGGAQDVRCGFRDGFYLVCRVGTETFGLTLGIAG